MRKASLSFYPISLPFKHTGILVLERVSSKETPSTPSSMSNQGTAMGERKGQGREGKDLSLEHKHLCKESAEEEDG